MVEKNHLEDEKMFSKNNSKSAPKTENSSNQKVNTIHLNNISIHSEKVINSNKVSLDYSVLEIMKNTFFLPDKSSFIPLLREKPSKILVFTRPSGFGKSTFLSLLECFFDAKRNKEIRTVDFNIFNHLAIDKYAINLNQGKYTVIFCDFLEFANANNFNEFICKFKFYLSSLYRKFDYIEKGLDANEAEYFRGIIDKKLTETTDLEIALSRLCQFIYRYNKDHNDNRNIRNHKPIVLIDEFDAPLHSIARTIFYQQASSFMQRVFRSLFQTSASNPPYEMAVLTGILPHKQLFPSFEDIYFHSTLQKSKYATAFGLTEVEVKRILQNHSFDAEREYTQIREKCGYYYCGKKMLFNPVLVIKTIHKINNLNHIYDTPIIARLHIISEESKNLIKALLKGDLVSSLTLDQVYLENPFSQLEFISEKGKKAATQTQPYALILDRYGQWFFRNKHSYGYEYVSELINSSIYNLLAKEPNTINKFAIDIRFLNENVALKRKILDVLVAEKNLVHLNEKVWLINLLYAIGLLTALPLNRNDAVIDKSELIFMIPNQEAFNFYLSQLNLSEDEYPYIPREVIIQKLSDNMPTARDNNLIKAYDFKQSLIKQGMFKERADTRIYLRIRVKVMSKSQNECIAYLKESLNKFEKQKLAIGANFSELNKRHFLDSHIFIITLAFANSKALNLFYTNRLPEFLANPIFLSFKKAVQYPHTDDNKYFWDLYPLNQNAYTLKSFGVMGNEDRDYSRLPFS